MVAVLQQVGGGRIIAIDRAVVLVGRSADCDVVITASAKISRRHCCLVQVDKDYYLRDLGSMNGVWLNGARVKRESVMRAGDRVTIGDVEFLFHPNARIEPKKTVVSPAAQASAAAPAAQVAPAPQGAPPNLAPQPKPAPRLAQGTAAIQGTAAAQKRPVAEAAAAANSTSTHPASVKPVAGRSAATGNNGSKNSRRLADRPQVFQANADVFEIIDDVIPLDESGIPMIGTNELEVIDDLIIDEDDLHQTE